MAVTINKPKRSRGHAKALPCNSLDQPGRLWIGHLETLYNISHSGVYTYLRRNLIPPPDGRVGRRPYWKSATIKAHLEE